MRLEDIVKNEYIKLAESLDNILKENTDYVVEINMETNTEINENSFLDVYGNNRKKILTAKYQLLGTFDIGNEIFIWGSNQVIVDKELILFSKIVKKYSAKIKKYIIQKKCEDVEYMERIYYYISNSVFFIEKDKIEEIIKFAVFVTKCKGIIKSVNTNASNNKIMSLYFITDIISY